MNSPDLLRLLLETTLASSAAIVAVLLLRRPVRHRLGASAAYLLWLAVPASLLAVLLPAPRVQAVPMLATGIVDAAAPMLATPAASLPWSKLVMGLWLAGGLVAGACLLLQQRRFIKGLGRVARRADGFWQAQAVVGLPAVVGVLRPRIVLPAGFEQRYNLQE